MLPFLSGLQGIQKPPVTSCKSGNDYLSLFLKSSEYLYRKLSITENNISNLSLVELILFRAIIGYI